MPEITSPGTPPAVKINMLQLSQFRGVDMTSGVTRADPTRSPDAPNMMPDEDGYPVKRPGWVTVKEYDGPIYGAYSYTGTNGTVHLIHAGTKLWAGDTLVASDMAAAPSAAVQLQGRLWIVDGKTYRYYDGRTGATGPVTALADADPPQISVGRVPGQNGAGGSYMPVNMLTRWVTDSFMVQDKNKDQVIFQLSFTGLASAAVRVMKGNAAGGWDAVTTGYTVNAAAGTVTFTAAPFADGVPRDGEDNIRVTYQRGALEAADINACRFSILFGVNGALDRVFLTGNAAKPNTDWWSDFEKPWYIGDIFYARLGQEGSAICGYNVMGDKLVTIKNGEENERNVFVRRGELDEENFAVFPLVDVLKGEGAMARRSFATLAGEPVYLSPRGVMALTTGDVTGERYVQGRSYYLNGALTRETGLENSSAVAWGRFYVFTGANARLYLLDGEQKAYERNEPHSSHQFEAYYWEGVPASVLFVRDGDLYFGTQYGRVCRFTRGKDAVYTDDGAAIPAWWTTPLMNLDRWGRLKTVTSVWMVGQPAAKSSGEVLYATDKEWARRVRGYVMDSFTFANVDFARWTFITLDRPMIAPARKKAKKVKLFAVRVRNTVAGEPFGILAIELEYRHGGKIKR